MIRHSGLKHGIFLIKLNGKTLRIKDCPGFSSVRGLMFDSLKDCDGALIYANSIWMPFVKHALTLFFLDKDFRIIKIQDAIPMTLDPKTWRVYACAKAKYCLETRGISGKGLEGKRIRFYS